MNNTVSTIELGRLAIAFLPVIPVILILARWSGKGLNASYATVRMVVQLIGVGYLLVFLFNTKSFLVICAVLGVMLLAASWISLGPVKERRLTLFPWTLLALAIGGGVALVVVLGGVLNHEPWYDPRFAIPLAGIVFANAMNSVSLAAERFFADVSIGMEAGDAKKVALQTGMIPVINSMLAVGIVALPGMMTGQILSGVSPLIAVRYQIVVMCMIFSASGLSTAIYLQIVSNTGRCRLGTQEG